MPSINTSDRALVKLGLARELTSLLGAVHHPPHLSHPSQKPRVPDTHKAQMYRPAITQVPTATTTTTTHTTGAWK
ncbi:hypothetical protein CKAH01_12898 [Colletotrichum kahawae]|uniref:Uncharacterized protein n=1 Tax=Colletotrichum kahawae TaxID=34407 RepID=A0AAD9YTY3_COLKA|nr:hypothetical protein CKAH01_12898 [Colletotrichum kahawae]